jgi:hypothetical protein
MMTDRDNGSSTILSNWSFVIPIALPDSK